MRDLSFAAIVKTIVKTAVLFAFPLVAFLLVPPGSASAQTPGAGAATTTIVTAELAQKVNSKNAKVGDDVVAKTTEEAQLADGTKLPKGTRLMGKVTEVQAKAGAQQDGHLAFLLDHAVVKDSPDIAIHATLISISAPALPAMDDHIAGGLGGGMTPEGAQVAHGGSSGGPLPGVAVSSSASAGSVLDAKGKNVELSGGMQMVLSVSAK